MISYSRPKHSDLYTLSQSKLPENHTLHSGTYLHGPYMAVTPRAGSQVTYQKGGNMFFHQMCGMHWFPYTTALIMVERGEKNYSKILRDRKRKSYLLNLRTTIFRPRWWLKELVLPTNPRALIVKTLPSLRAIYKRSHLIPSCFLIAMLIKSFRFWLRHQHSLYPSSIPNTTSHSQRCTTDKKSQHRRHWSRYRRLELFSLHSGTFWITSYHRCI